MQVVVNKAASLVGTLLTMYLLAPDLFGVAAIATSILAYVALLPAFTLSDVLLARPAEAPGVLRAASRLCATVTLATVALLMSVGWWTAHSCGDDRILAACAVLSLRPIAELLLFVPQTALRLRLDFGRMARIDALTQCGSTALTVAMAWLGAGYVSLLLPQSLAVLARAVLYARSAGPLAGETPSVPRQWKRLLSDYWMSGLGQYVHGSLLVAPPLVLASFCDSTTVGWYSTAFALSTSFNTVVAVSIGLVLQPIFAQMGDDIERQRQAFVRACAVIAALAMPVCLCQAACVGPAFSLFLPDKWGGAAVFCQLMSAGQAFYFAVNPAMGLLKAQGRFSTFFAWQGVQLAVVVAAMVVAGWASPEPGLAIIAVFGFYHLVFSPIGIALCVPSGHGLGRALVDVFLRPLAASACAIGPAAAVFAFIGDGPALRLAALVALPAVTVVTYPLWLRLFAPEIHASFGEMVSMLRRRFARAS